MPRRKMWVEWDDDANLSQSQKKLGDYSPLTRDSSNKLGQATMSDVDDDDSSPSYSPQLHGSDPGEQAPEISSLVPWALVAVAGIAVGVAGAKVARHTKSQPKGRKRKRKVTAAACGAPAAWYEVAGDTTRLRYWNGSHWTNDFAQRHRIGGLGADWYVDPWNATQLRYWNGTAWTHHIAPRERAALTADWYVDPWNVAQLRYWNGRGWTAHTGPRRVAAPLYATGTESVGAREGARTMMSSAEWQAAFRVWLSAGAIGQELWRRLSNAHISDADDATLAAQEEMGRLTPQQAAHRIQSTLEAHPHLRIEGPLSEFMKVLGLDTPVAVGGHTTDHARRSIPQPH